MIAVAAIVWVAWSNIRGTSTTRLRTLMRISLANLALGTVVIGYGLARSFAGLFRGPDVHLGFRVGGLAMGQLLSLPMILAGVLIVLVARHRARALPFVISNPALAVIVTSDRLDDYVYLLALRAEGTPLPGSPPPLRALRHRAGRGPGGAAAPERLPVELLALGGEPAR